MQQIIDQYKQIALSDHDILQLVDGRAKVVLYPDLVNVHHIDEILMPYGACFLLYEAMPHFGHWCCLLLTVDETGQSSLEFFDPYGGFPDTQRQYIPELFRKMSNQDVPHLSSLLLESPYNLSYNQYQFQKKSDKVRDCGRWCALRLQLKHLPLEAFKYLFYGKNSDDLATFLTMHPSQAK